MAIATVTKCSSWRVEIAKESLLSEKDFKALNKIQQKEL
jgi:hypothetical protein